MVLRRQGRSKKDDVIRIVGACAGSIKGRFVLCKPIEIGPNETFRRGVIDGDGCGVAGLQLQSALDIGDQVLDLLHRIARADEPMILENDNFGIRFYPRKDLACQRQTWLCIGHHGEFQTGKLLRSFSATFWADRVGDRHDGMGVGHDAMIEGRMKKFVAESTLLNQQFVVNPDLTVEAAAKEAGATITGFIRLEVGEGIVVEKEDFAAEVAKAAQG